jgi:hypothetical protein
VEFGGTQPTPGSDPDAVVGEEWPVWHDGRSFPRFPSSAATIEVWRRFKQRTVVYMTDKDSELSKAQFDQLNTRLDRANAAIERLLPATPPVPETGAGSDTDLGPTDPDQWTEPDSPFGNR